MDVGVRSHDLSKNNIAWKERTSNKRISVSTANPQLEFWWITSRMRFGYTTAGPTLSVNEWLSHCYHYRFVLWRSPFWF